ncbi:hypothetical protein [Actinoplanes subglobosus]|uniref:TrbC/VIRB2 family protein n=1 Tax=Actinoplanes subglobosus TaxID=1547892 RepID=A0ABV8IV35_9ACTN
MIHELVHDLATLASAAVDTISGVLVAQPAPDPGSGEAPPGADKIITILRWAKWIFTALAVLGGIFIAGGMVLAHRRGDDAQVGKLGIFLGACVFAGVVPNIVDALA